MEAMSALLLLAFLFLCGLLNSFIFPFSKLFPCLRSLFSAFSPPKPRPPKTASLDDDIKEKRGESDLQTVFSTFDADDDGFISKEELAESLRRLGFAATGSEIRSMMERADTDGDGLINLSEFRELYFSWGSMTAGSGGGGMGVDEKGEEESELREAFRVFDGDGDGLITVEELSLVLKSLGLKQGDRADACKEMIKSVDLDGDGMVNFEEFKKMMVVKGGKIF